jgi:hypothetical protein
VVFVNSMWVNMLFDLTHTREVSIIVHISYSVSQYLQVEGMTAFSVYSIIYVCEKSTGLNEKVLITII